MEANEREMFCEVLYSAQEIVFTYHERKYCVQGYTENGKAHMYLAQWEPECGKPIVWECTADLMDQCGEKFIAAPILRARPFGRLNLKLRGLMIRYCPSPF